MSAMSSYLTSQLYQANQACGLMPHDSDQLYATQTQGKVILQGSTFFF